MMRTIYSKIAVIILMIMPMLNCYGQPDSDMFMGSPPPEGNWLRIYYSDKAYQEGTYSFTTIKIKYNDSLVFKFPNSYMSFRFLKHFSNPESFHKYYKDFFLENKDTNNFVFETNQGRITLSLVNGSLLSDTNPTRFILNSFPRIPGRYIIKLERNKDRHGVFRIVRGRGYGYDITPKHWINHLVNPPCQQPEAPSSPMGGNLIIAYNNDFNTPLKKGQYISLNPKNTISQKPYVIIPDILDSILKVNKENYAWSKYSRPWEVLAYKVKVYTDRGIYKLRISLHEGEFDYPFSQEVLSHCYFTVLPPFNSKVNGVEDRDVVEISNRLRANYYYDFKGTCCRRLRYLVIRDNEVIEDWSKDK